MAVTSLTGLNCKSSLRYRRFESLGVIIDFSKRSVTSAPSGARIGIRILDFASLCFHRHELRHRKDLKPEYTLEYKSRRKSFFIARLPPCRSSSSSKREGPDCMTVSIDKTRTTARRFIRAKSLAPKCQESVARPARQHPISMLGEPRSRTFPFFTTPRETREHLLNCLSSSPCRGVAITRHVLCKCLGATPLGGTPPVI